MDNFENWKEQLQQARNELKALENPSAGTPEQQATLKRLREINPMYKYDRNILVTKIAYLEAELAKESHKRMMDQMKAQELYYEAMLDDIG